MRHKRLTLNIEASLSRIASAQWVYNSCLHTTEFPLVKTDEVGADRSRALAEPSGGMHCVRGHDETGVVGKCFETTSLGRWSLALWGEYLARGGHAVALTGPVGDFAGVGAVVEVEWWVIVAVAKGVSD